MRIWLVNWHFQSRITLWCRHKSTNVSMGLCWQMPKFIVWRLWFSYFDYYLPLKPSIWENGGGKVVHLIFYLIIPFILFVLFYLFIYLILILYFILLFYFINIILYCYIIFLYLYQKREISIVRFLRWGQLLICDPSALWINLEHATRQTYNFGVKHNKFLALGLLENHVVKLVIC